MMLKRLTLCSRNQTIHACQAFGGVFFHAPVVTTGEQVDCPLLSDWSTLRRHRSLYSSCSSRGTALVAYSADPAYEAADAPDSGFSPDVRSTDRMADCAGWTEVVIPRGFNDLFDLPVGLLPADANTRNGHRPYPVISSGYVTGDGGADDRWGPEDQTDGFSQPDFYGLKSTCGCRESEAVGRISCQNNNEVTL